MQPLRLKSRGGRCFTDSRLSGLKPTVSLPDCLHGESYGVAPSACFRNLSTSDCYSGPDQQPQQADLVGQVSVALPPTAVQGGGATSSQILGTNVDVSDECGPQSETFITVNPSRPSMLAAGSNEIFRDPMRGYFSSNAGKSWGAVDLPLPLPRQGTNDVPLVLIHRLLLIPVAISFTGTLSF